MSEPQANSLFGFLTTRRIRPRGLFCSVLVNFALVNFALVNLVTLQQCISSLSAPCSAFVEVRDSLSGRHQTAAVLLYMHKQDVSCLLIADIIIETKMGQWKKSNSLCLSISKTTIWPQALVGHRSWTPLMPKTKGRGNSFGLKCKLWYVLIPSNILQIRIYSLQKYFWSVLILYQLDSSCKKWMVSPKCVCVSPKGGKIN